MADLEGGFSDRVKAILTATSFILAIVGWAFSLGVTYSRLATNEVETERLRVSSIETDKQVSELKERLGKLEVVATSIDSTLKGIRDDIRDIGKSGK